MRVARFLTVFAATAVLAGVVSCGGDSTGPGGGGNGSVHVTPATDSLTIGATTTLSASVVDGAGHPVSGASVFWNTENANVASVSSNGTVTALDTGTVRIAASSPGKASGFSSITVVPKAVASVRVTPSSAVLKVGGTVHLQAAPLDAGGNTLSGRTITWSSDNTSVATVDSTGLVTAVGAGATTVHAKCEGQDGTSGIAVSLPTPAQITIAPPGVSMNVGGTAQLSATVKDSVGAVISGATVNWVSSNEGVATVSSSGLVRGIAEGSATITASSGPAHANVTATVTPIPANAVIVSPSAQELLVTQTVQLQATVTDANGDTLSGRPVTWETNNPATATVSTSGLVRALLPGTAIITATSGSAHGTATITVRLVPTTNVSVAPDAATLYIGQNQQLSAFALDSAGDTLSGRPATWSTSAAPVATVSSAGLVTAVKVGSAVITAKIENQKGTSTITVQQVPVRSVQVTPSDTTITLGDTVQLAAVPLDSAGGVLTGRSVQWLSSDRSVAVVTSTGDVFTRGAGSATITATIDGVPGSATVTVTPVPVATVTVSPTLDSIDISGTSQFKATLKDAQGNTLTGRAVTWTSSNPSVATIDSASGLATAASAGSTTITATSEGKTGTAALVVRQAPVASVTVSPQTASLAVGDTLTLTATPLDKDNTPLTGRDITWSTSDQTIATVTSAGLVTALAPGRATIQATSENKNGSSTITVAAPAPPGP